MSEMTAAKRIGLLGTARGTGLAACGKARLYYGEGGDSRTAEQFSNCEKMGRALPRMAQQHLASWPSVVPGLLRGKILLSCRGNGHPDE
jgi:hypothetical protein